MNRAVIRGAASVAMFRGTTMGHPTGVFCIGLAILGLSTCPAQTAESRGTASRRTAVVEVYERTHKAVVNISGQRVVETSVWPD